MKLAVFAEGHPCGTRRTYPAHGDSLNFDLFGISDRMHTRLDCAEAALDLVVTIRQGGYKRAAYTVASGAIDP